MRYLLQPIWCVAQAAMLLVGSGTYALSAPPRMPSSAVVISLYPKCNIASHEILIADVARVETANAALKSQIESLDLTDAPAPGEATAVTAKTIEFRLRMAGLDARSITIKGTQSEVTAGGKTHLARDTRIEPVRTTAYVPGRSTRFELSTPELEVESPAPSKRSQVTEEVGGPGQSVEDAIVAAARKVVLEQLPWSADDVSFRLAQPLGRDAKLFNTGERYTCVAELRGNAPPLGRVNVDVTMKSDLQAPIEIAVALEVRHFETVVATARPVAKGRKIQKEDLYMHRWDVTAATDYSTQLEQLIGRTALRTLAAAQIVREKDLDKAAESLANGDQSVRIKRADRIKILGRIGNLAVTVSGEAMQDGRIGDTIRVQNTESKSIVQGKIISAEEVEIAY
ncbi:MAG TPA: flagellar basal body P-ring formation chaperone FlgA [Schlesneria sp.]|jgi:flagella basal body P-ring formation protein FlgA